MGGSGGGYFRGGADPGELARRLRDTEAQTRDEGYETGVNQQLGEFLKDFNARDVAGTREVLDDVKKELTDEIGGTVDLVYGGSVSRHTYLEGLSDTDALVIIDPGDTGRTSPEQLKGRFAERLRELFGKENVNVGDLAVTVIVRGKEVQLVPAMRDGEGYRIAASDGRSWSKINPRAFAEKLTQANKAQDGKLVPTIKVTKAIIATLPKQQQLTGYHVESLAIEAFKNYEGPRTYKDMVAHFFDRSAELVKAPIADRSGQSVHVDEYLGAVNSQARRLVSQALQRVQRKLQNADASKSVDAWKDLVGGT
ncbi:MAG: CBASS oligonucleotide cyclase [Pseudomonadales bacterium]